MPNTYEKVVDDVVVERSLAFAGTTHDLQLSAQASAVDSPWFAVDANGQRVKLNPMPVFTEPSDVDALVDEPSPDSAPAQVEAVVPATTDQPDESGDHTEE